MQSYLVFIGKYAWVLSASGTYSKVGEMFQRENHTPKKPIHSICTYHSCPFLRREKPCALHPNTTAGVDYLFSSPNRHAAENAAFFRKPTNNIQIRQFLNVEFCPFCSNLCTRLWFDLALCLSSSFLFITSSIHAH